MADLVLGPLLRYVPDPEATIWVETDGPCEVAVLGAVEPTFGVEGHHYALVRVEGLKPGTEHPYDVRLDGEVVWPPQDSRLPPPPRGPPAAGGSGRRRTRGSRRRRCARSAARARSRSPSAPAGSPSPTRTPGP